MGKCKECGGSGRIWSSWDAAGKAGEATWRPCPAGKSNCFIATAAYGTPSANAVVLLRSFRDEHLAVNAVGRAAIMCYEFISPPIAAIIRSSAVLRWFVRVVLVAPIAWVLAKMYSLRR